MKPECFWNYSILEISDIINSYCKRENVKYKSEIRNVFMQADIIANRIGKMLDSNTKEIMLWDYFPELFAADKRQYEESIKMTELENYKAKRKAAMEKYNQSR